MNKGHPTLVQNLPSVYNHQLGENVYSAVGKSAIQTTKQTIETHAGAYISISDGNEWLQVEIEGLEGKFEINTLRDVMTKELVRELVDYKSKTLVFASVYPVFIRFIDTVDSFIYINTSANVLNANCLFFGDCKDLLPVGGSPLTQYEQEITCNQFDKIIITHNLNRVVSSIILFNNETWGSMESIKNSADPLNVVEFNAPYHFSGKVIIK